MKFSLQVEMTDTSVRLGSCTENGAPIGVTLVVQHTVFVKHEEEPVFKGFPAATSGHGSVKDLSVAVTCPGRLLHSVVSPMAH